MEILINILLGVGFIMGITYLFLSMFVLHTYEVESKKSPPSLQFWAFNKEIKDYYPGLSKLGRFLEVGATVCFLLYFVN